MSETSAPEETVLKDHEVQPILSVNPNDPEDLSRQISGLKKDLEDAWAELKKFNKGDELFTLATAHWNKSSATFHLQSYRM
jgi:hypothetical protein